MIQISEVNIISIDKGEDSWEIEGEILFEEDLSTAFAVTYLLEDEDLEELTLEIDPGAFDRKQLKDMVLSAAFEYED